MKRVICSVLCILLLLLAGCGNKGEPSASNDGSEVTNADADIEDNNQSPDCESIITTLKDGGIPISHYIVYDEETDPNIIEYGEDAVLDYQQKANFADERIEPDYDEKEPQSGTVETFSTSTEAATRADALYESGGDVFSYRILSDKILVRLSAGYTKDQAQEIADIIGGTIHSIDDDVVLREEFGDTLNAYQGEWQLVKNQYSRLVIVGDELNFIHEMTIGEKNYCDVNTFYFGLDEDKNLVVVNGYSQIRYTISLGEDGLLTIADVGGDEEPDIYEKVSDNTEVPKEIVDPEIGMTASEVRASTWGSPKKVNKTTMATGVQEQWVYESGYIYFEDGIVTAIQDR